MASTNSTATAKTHVSLRLPTYLLESIDAHAERESISRTEAFVFYLQTGLDIADVKADEPSKDESMLMSIQEDLAEIKALLQQGAAPSVPAQAIAETIAPVVEAPSVFTSEEAAKSEAYAEENFMGSDAVSEETLANEPEEASDEASSNSIYATEERAEAEAEAEENYTTSDAVSEETFSTHEVVLEDAFASHETDDEPENEDEAAIEDNGNDTDELVEEENMFTTSDAVMEETAEEPSNSVFALYANGDSEEYTEIKPVESIDDFTTSDAITFEEVESDDENEDKLAEEESMFSTSDAEEEESQEANNFYSFATDVDLEDDVDSANADEDESFDEGEDEDGNEDNQSSDEDETVEELYDFDTSDAVDYEEAEDEVDPCDEALSYKKLEKAVAKASKQIDFIEKVWLFGPAADEEEITVPVLDLCVKTEDDKKLKSKHLDPYISTIEEKTGKITNVVLRHEIEDKSELQNRIEIYKR